MNEMKLGAFIKNRRKELGMTQSSLGEKLHVTDKAISRWERGIGFPDIKLLEPLAEALQISVQELLQCERVNSEQIVPEMTETTPKKQSWFEKHSKIIAVICFFIYIVIYDLSQNPKFSAQTVWLSPLSHLLFLFTVAAFLLVSYRGAKNG